MAVSVNSVMGISFGLCALGDLYSDTHHKTQQSSINPMLPPLHNDVRHSAKKASIMSMLPPFVLPSLFLFSHRLTRSNNDIAAGYLLGAAASGLTIVCIGCDIWKPYANRAFSKCMLIAGILAMAHNLVNMTNCKEGQNGEALQLQISALNEERETFRNEIHRVNEEKQSEINRLQDEIQRLQQNIQLLHGNRHALNKLDLNALKELEAKLTDSMKNIQAQKDELHDNRNLCVICCHEPKSIMLNGCDHVTLCEHCEPKLQPKQCPLCRTPYTNARKLIM